MPQEKEQFYMVNRVLLKNSKEAHSTEYFDDYKLAIRRFYNIMASDTYGEGVTYNFCSIVDGLTGLALETGLVDDRPLPEPEPTPEPEE